MKLLDAINLCLRATQETRVSSLSFNDAAAADVLPTIAELRREILSRGWPFNTRVVTLPLDVNGRVPMPSSWLSYKLPDKLSVNDEGFVWDVDADTYRDSPVKDATVIYDYGDTAEGFAAIPDQFGRWIAHAAAERCWEDRKGSPSPMLSRRTRQAMVNACNSLSHQVDAGESTGWNFTRSGYGGRSWGGR